MRSQVSYRTLVVALAPLITAMYVGMAGWPGNARAGRVIHEGVSLHELIWQSTFILVVKEAEPPSRTKEFDLCVQKKTFRGENCGRFSVWISRFVVQEVIYANGPKDEATKLVGETLEVVTPDVKSNMQSHLRYQLAGWHESSVRRRYGAGSAVSPVHDGEFIVFLKKYHPYQSSITISRGDKVFHDDGQLVNAALAALPKWSFVVPRARETLDRKPDILAILKKMEEPCRAKFERPALEAAPRQGKTAIPPEVWV